MLKISVIADSLVPDRPCRDLLRAARSRGLTAKYVPISMLSVALDESGVSLVIRNNKFSVDGVFLRSLGLLIDVDQFVRRVTVMKLIEDSGVLMINPLVPFLTARNKLETMIILKRCGIRVPRTYCTEDLIHAYGIAKRLKDFVIKPIQGSKGIGSVRLNDADVAFHVMKTLMSLKKPIYIQEYVNKPDRDIRAFVIDGELFGCMYRISTSGWKTNIFQGAKGVVCDRVDEELKEISIKAAESLGLIYAGVDVGEDSSGYVVFEVNGSPEWRELSEVTGKNPADRLVDVMIEKLKR